MNLYDPTKKERQALITTTGHPVEAPGHPDKARAFYRERLRQACEKMGVPMSEAFVVHRDKTPEQCPPRHWNLNTLGGETYCKILLQGDWRLGTPEESRAAIEQYKAEKAEIARRKLNYDMMAHQKLSADRHFQMMVDAAGSAKDDLAKMSPEDLDALLAKVKEAKAMAKEAKDK